MPKNSYHVVPDPNGGWNVRRRGAKRASKHFSTQEAAVSWGRRISREQSSDFVIHKRDGTVQEKIYRGSEPIPARG